MPHANHESPFPAITAESGEVLVESDTIALAVSRLNRCRCDGYDRIRDSSKGLVGRGTAAA